MLRVGDELPGGWVVTQAEPGAEASRKWDGTWVEPQPGHYAASLTIDGRTVKDFRATSERKLRDRCASWLADQSRRKDAGVLGRPTIPKIVVKGGAPR